MKPGLAHIFKTRNMDSLGIGTYPGTYNVNTVNDSVTFTDFKVRYPFLKRIAPSRKHLQVDTVEWPKWCEIH